LAKEKPTGEKTAVFPKILPPGQNVSPRRLAIMRILLPVIALSLLAFGCHPKSRQPVVVEDDTPIVGASGTTEALGIETLGGVFTPLIKPGSTVPCTHSEVFSTAADGQSQIMVTLFRGTNQMRTSAHALGRFQVVGIPAARRGTPKVEITFAITQTQILLSARDLTQMTDLQIRRLSGDSKQ
jgi:molecular chaperone DnaK (HSP70)